MNLPSLRENFSLFPSLIESTNFFFKSEVDQKYNCIAWAIIRNDVWVAPNENLDGVFWPEKIERGETYEHLVALFASLGYQKCEDNSFENGFMKVALYGKDGKWTHAARQLVSGKWTSKMGICEDIEHLTPLVLEGEGYGYVFQVMKRPNSSYQEKKTKLK